jgi:hypothetical protein
MQQLELLKNGSASTMVLPGLKPLQLITGWLWTSGARITGILLWNTMCSSVK